MRVTDGGHSGTVMLALRILLLVVWTPEAYHYCSGFFSPIVPLSSLFVHLCSLSLLLLQPRTNREVYLS